MLRDFFHHQLHFIEGHGIATSDLNKNSVGFAEQLTTIEKRTFESLLHRFQRTIITFRKSVTKETTRVVGVESRKEVVHSDPNNSRTENDVHRSANALADNLVGCSKRLCDTVPGHDQFAHAIVIEGDNRVGIPRDRFESVCRLPRSALSLKGKGHGREHDKEYSLFASNPAYLRGGTRTGSTAETNAKEKHPIPANGLTDFINRFKSSLASQRRIASRSHTFQQGRTKLNFV